MKKRQPRDLMLVMSDQHCGLESPAKMTHLSQISAEGLTFSHCYANAPLCVPSRMSFLSGQLPSDLGIFDNDCALPSDVPTIAHALGALGYHTALVGRMHFKGDDQRHGFDERLCGDITSQYWGTGGKSRAEFGAYAGTTNRLHCLEAVGGGESPVTLYDRAVFEEAIQFLERWYGGSNRPPLFLVVGFYGPHFPFVCEERLFQTYQTQLDLQRCRQEYQEKPLPIYQGLRQEADADLVRDCRAAYYGLLEMLDGYLGALYERFQKKTAGREWAFCYTSDHGEQLGRRGIFGKQTMYEEALRVPLVWAGTGIAKNCVRKETVSLLDVSRTLLDLAGPAKPENFSWHKGRSLNVTATPGAIRESLAFSESSWVRAQQLLFDCGFWHLIEAAIDRHRKVLQIDGAWTVFDLQKDLRGRHEVENLLPASDQRSSQAVCQAQAAGCFLPNEERRFLEARQQAVTERHKLLAAWGRSKHPHEEATMQISPEKLRVPRPHRHE